MKVQVTLSQYCQNSSFSLAIFSIQEGDFEKSIFTWYSSVHERWSMNKIKFSSDKLIFVIVPYV